MGAFVFRKSVANDLIDLPFSVIGSSIAGAIGFVISNNIFSTLKFPVLITVGLFFVAGFIVADWIGDGYAEGGS